MLQFQPALIASGKDIHGARPKLGHSTVSVRYIHCKKRGVTGHPRGAIFYCFHGNSMGYHGNSKILLPWGVLIHHVFYSVAPGILPELARVQHSSSQMLHHTCEAQLQILYALNPKV